MKTDIFSGEPIYLYYISLEEAIYIYYFSEIIDDLVMPYYWVGKVSGNTWCMPYERSIM